MSTTLPPGAFACVFLHAIVDSWYDSTCKSPIRRLCSFHGSSNMYFGQFLVSWRIFEEPSYLRRCQTLLIILSTNMSDGMQKYNLNNCGLGRTGRIWIMLPSFTRCPCQRMSLQCLDGILLAMYVQLWRWDTIHEHIQLVNTQTFFVLYSFTSLDNMISICSQRLDIDMLPCHLFGYLLACCISRSECFCHLLG